MRHFYCENIFQIFLDFIWTWTSHLKNFSDCGRTWTEFLKIGLDRIAKYDRPLISAFYPNMRLSLLSKMERFTWNGSVFFHKF